MDEDPQKVTITLHERHPPLLSRDGVEMGESLVRTTRSVTVPLQSPLGDRVLCDGFSGLPGPGSSHEIEFEA